MTKVCKEHIKNPAMIYGKCVGCEIEYYQKKILELEGVIKDLRQKEEKKCRQE